MRLRFKTTREQRHTMRAQFARLQSQPDAVLEIVRPGLPAGVVPDAVECSIPSRHPDRFVMRVEVRWGAGTGHRAFALKVYSDDFGQRVWDQTQTLAAHCRPNLGAFCLPERFIPHERTLVFPWVDGPFLSEIVDERKLDLLRRAATVAATLHRLPIIPEHETTAEMIVADTVARCGRLRERWPVTAPLVEPLIAALEEASGALDPADPAPVHGDLAAGQFLWTGERLVLLDFDMLGYADPAYDAGHFLGQLERRCLLDTTLPPGSRDWLAAFREEYLAAMPQVSVRNVWFYHGLALIRKIYTVCRREPETGPTLIRPFAFRAQAALQEALGPGVVL